MSKQEHWLDEPEDHDFDAAREYLSLLMSDDGADSVVFDLKSGGRLTWFKAKDILRASELPALPEDNAHVAKDLDKIKCQEKLSPVLLVRGGSGAGKQLTIADGYHRVCASYILDEDAEIPARFV